MAPSRTKPARGTVARGKIKRPENPRLPAAVKKDAEDEPFRVQSSGIETRPKKARNTAALEERGVEPWDVKIG